MATRRTKGDRPGTTVALTGASGAVYGITLARELLRLGVAVEFIVSAPGREILAEEMGIRLSGRMDHDYAELRKILGPGTLHLHDNDDLFSPLASGSALAGPMLVAPCSMGTAARIARGVSLSLIERAADVTIKERRTLVLLPRETPLSAVHLENLLALSRAGAVILPPMPAFYHHPETMDDLVDFVVGKALDAIGLEHGLYRRWGSP